MEQGSRGKCAWNHERSCLPLWPLRLKVMRSRLGWHRASSGAHPRYGNGRAAWGTHNLHARQLRSKRARRPGYNGTHGSSTGGSIIYSRGDEAHLSYVAWAGKSLVSMIYYAWRRGVMDPTDATALGFDDIGGLLPVERRPRSATADGALRRLSPGGQPRRRLRSGPAPRLGAAGSVLPLQQLGFQRARRHLRATHRPTSIRVSKRTSPGRLACRTGIRARRRCATTPGNRRTRRNTSCCRRATWRAWAAHVA